MTAHAEVAPRDAEPSPAEARLEANRARLRHALAPQARRADGPRQADGDDSLGPMEVLEHVVAPAASEIVRRYPARSLAGAALAGALLVRLRPWSGLLGSVVTTALIRQVSSASVDWAARQLDAAPGSDDR
ncbi:MAG: hypothetical protein KDH20_16235 [Rhodocyclaceae bacterium]|nr:hypothetical protein [Rhodocyclaceae bacterium]